MNNDFLLFLDNNGDCQFGYYRTVALFPMSHRKKNKLWLPYEFLMDMSRILILAERRNFQNEYAKRIAGKFQLVINRSELDHLPLVDIWRPYYGQQVKKNYRWDQCFQVDFEDVDADRMKQKHLPSLSNQPLYEWYFDYRPLLHFFSDPRFQGFLVHSGFQPETDQLQFDLSA